MSEPHRIYYKDNTTVHGFQHIAFEDYRLPAWMWRRMSVCIDTGCWEWGEWKKHYTPKYIVVMRLLGVTRDEIYRVIETCANDKCVNPRHLCVTLRRVDTN